MTATASRIFDLTRPQESAERLWRLNMELAEQPAVTAEVRDRARSFLEAMERSDLGAWDEIDPRHALLAHRAGMAALAALDRDDRDGLRMALDGLTQALDAIAEGEPVSDARSGKELVQFLAAVTEASQARLAELLGVSLRQFQRWLSPIERAKPEGDDLRKVRAVARIVNQLRFSLTPAGAVDWFWWRLPGRRTAPVDLLADPAQLPELLRQASSLRSTVFA
jgi:transcriptional regulator with XRE-family HTH domain